MQATAIAMLTSREAFSEATQIESGEKALTPIIKRILIDSGINEGRVDEVSRLLLYTVDGLIHRQVLYGGVASSDQKLVDFLVDLVLGYIDRRRD
jgi:hypothetical protein